MLLVNSKTTLVADLAHLTWEALALGLAYGLLSMAILQLVKDLYLRRAFNGREFEHWIGVGARAARDLKLPKSPEVPPMTPKEVEADARRDLLSLSCAGDEDALFGLPIEKLAGQINVATNSVIETPPRHGPLLLILGNAAAPQDLDLLLETDPSILRTSQREKPFLTPVEKLQEEQSVKLSLDYADARTRVSHHIQRTIDVLQLSAEQRWTRLNQWLSIAISVVLGIMAGLTPLFFSQWFSSRYGVFTVGFFLPVNIVLALIGGCLAPLLRDVTARLGQSG